MARREIPEPWATYMQRKGLTSVRRLAEVAGVSAPAVSRLLHGEGRQEDDTIVRIADALGLDLSTVYELAGTPQPEAARYIPPAESHRLTNRQRKAIDELIRATVADLEQEES